MDLTLSPQDDPETTARDALRHRKELEIPGADGNSSGGAVENGLAENGGAAGKLSTSSSYGHLNPTISDPSTELTEDDIFRMKKLRVSKLTSEVGDQCSAVSVVDSTSNFGERLGAADANTEDEAEDEDEEEVELDGATEASSELDSGAAAVTDFPPQQRARKGSKATGGDYVFGRNRTEQIKLNPETVTMLQYPFVPAVVPAGVEPKAYADAFTAARVYLVGTAHFSAESQRDVRQTILGSQPDVVMVELCSSRISILSMEEEVLLREAQNLNRQSIIAIIRQSGLVQGILHTLLLSISAHITRQLGMAPGGEFRAAHAASRQVRNCQIVLGDRPIQITLQRVLGSLSVFQKIRLFFRILLSNNESITQEDVERCKNKDLLEELLNEMAGQFPQLKRILVEERDAYMTHILHNLVQRSTVEKWNEAKLASVPFEPVNVVAVVGIGHVAGIVEHWNRHVDSSDLLTIPQPSKTSRAVKFVLKGVIVGASLYGVYRVGKFSACKIAALLPAKY